MKNGYSVVMVTCASRGEAVRIARRLLDMRLVACANILGGIESRYRWKGRLERSSEVLLMLKTSSANFGRIEREVKRLHSYEVPEIAGLPITAGSREYLQWIRASVKCKI
jgi:periplasmic divalent cation tolerance protein